MLTECVSVDTLVDSLKSMIQVHTGVQQVPFTCNLQRFHQSVNVIGLQSKVKGADITLEDVFEAFEEPSCFALKVIYSLAGEKLKIDYTLTASCYHISIKQQ
jgi:hypothetical protein